MPLFQTPAIIQSVRTMVDGGNKLDVVTRELAPEEMTELFRLKNKEGWLLFKENAIEMEDIQNLPDEPLEKFDKKSPSERLRDRMFVYYKKTHKDTSGFNLWYDQSLDKIGSSYLEKIN